MMTVPTCVETIQTFSSCIFQYYRAAGRHARLFVIFTAKDCVLCAQLSLSAGRRATLVPKPGRTTRKYSACGNCSATAPACTKKQVEMQAWSGKPSPQVRSKLFWTKAKLCNRTDLWLWPPPRRRRSSETLLPDCCWTPDRKVTAASELYASPTGSVLIPDREITAASTPAGSLVTASCGTSR